MRKGALFIDHTTVSATIARQLSVEAEGAAACCASMRPVSGGQAGAENGTLSIMCGGTKAAFEAAEPVMQAYAARIVHVGGPGAGQTTKMVNQIAIAGVLQGLSEALRFAQSSRARSRQGVRGDFGRRRAKLADGQPLGHDGEGRASTSALRSTGCARIWASRSTKRATNGATIPVAALRRSILMPRCRRLGGGRQDTSALIRKVAPQMMSALYSLSPPLAAGEPLAVSRARRHAGRQRQRHHPRREGQGRPLHRAGHRQGRQGQAAARPQATSAPNGSITSTTARAAP